MKLINRHAGYELPSRKRVFKMAKTIKILVVQDSPLISKILKIRLEAVVFPWTLRKPGKRNTKAMAVKYSYPAGFINFRN